MNIRSEKWKQTCYKRIGSRFTRVDILQTKIVHEQIFLIWLKSFKIDSSFVKWVGDIYIHVETVQQLLCVWWYHDRVGFFFFFRTTNVHKYQYAKSRSNWFRSLGNLYNGVKVQFCRNNIEENTWRKAWDYWFVAEWKYRLAVINCGTFV